MIIIAVLVIDCGIFLNSFNVVTQLLRPNLSSTRKSQLHRHKNNVVFEQRIRKIECGMKYKTTKDTVTAILRGVFDERDVLYPIMKNESSSSSSEDDEVCDEYAYFLNLYIFCVC